MQDTKKQLLYALSFTGLILIGLYLTTRIDLAFSSDLETFSGPRSYPALILAGMLVFNASIILQGYFAKGQPTVPVPEPNLTVKPRTWHALALFALLVMFCFAFEPIGYILTIIPLLIVVSRLNGAKSWSATILVSFILAAIGLVIFRYALNTVLPEGLFGIDRVF